MAKQKKDIAKNVTMPNLGDGVFVLPKALHEDVDKLDAALVVLRNELTLMEAQYKAMAAEFQGAESTVYAFFKADALARGFNMKTKRIELLGGFKYRLVDTRVPDAPPPMPPAVEPPSGDNEGAKPE